MIKKCSGSSNNRKLKATDIYKDTTVKTLKGKAG